MASARKMRGPMGPFWKGSAFEFSALRLRERCVAGHDAGCREGRPGKVGAPSLELVQLKSCCTQRRQGRSLASEPHPLLLKFKATPDLPCPPQIPWQERAEKAATKVESRVPVQDRSFLELVSTGRCSTARGGGRWVAQKEQGLAV